MGLDLFGTVGNFFTGGAGSSSKYLRNGIKDAKANEDVSYNANKGAFDPYTDLGKTAATGIQGLLGKQPGFEGNVNDYMTAAGAAPGSQPGSIGSFKGPEAYMPGQFNYQASPGVAAQTAAVSDAVQKSAAARGMLGSTNTTGQLAKQVGDVVAQDYGNEHSRFLQDEALKQGAQGQQYSQGLGAFGANLQGNEADRGQFNTNRNFGANNFQTQLGNFNTDNNTEYSRMLDMLGLGANSTKAKVDMETDHTKNINDLITADANTKAAAARAKYGAPGKIFGGIADLGKGAAGVASLFA